MERYNRLTVLETWVLKRETSTGRTEYRKMCRCKCDCGNQTVANYYKVRSGHTSSCGCLVTEMLVERNTTHGLRYHPLAQTYYAMIRRCEDKNHSSYHNYGGRGISVCDEWKNDISTFITWGDANGYRDGLQLDRIDNEGNYEPNNCRFVTVEANLRNTRGNVIIDGMILKDWLSKLSKEYNIKQTTLHSRYYRLKKKGIPITVDSITR